jgi:hypothetical protein
MLAVAGPALAKPPLKTTTTPTTQSSATTTVQGVVQAVGASAVVVRQLDGSVVSVGVDRRTKVTIDGKGGKIGDVKPGFVLLTTVKGGQPASTLRFLRPS